VRSPAPTVTAYLPHLADYEPWRGGRSPIPESGEICTGELQWEPGTIWWLCSKCGRIGQAPHFGHRAATPPMKESPNLETPHREYRHVVAALALMASAAITYWLRRL